MRGKQQDFRTEKYIRYGIRKFSFGAASVAIAVGLMFLGNGVVSAMDVQRAETAITTSASKETEKAEPKAETVETVNPETANPETVNSETVKPETANPETVNSETVKPETEKATEVKSEVAATMAATKATLANTDASQADVDAQAKTVSALSTAVTESNTAEKELKPTEIYTTNGTPAKALATDKEALTQVTKENFLDYFLLNGSATYDQNYGIVTITPDDYNKVGNFSLKSKIDMNSNFTLTGQVYLGDKTSSQGGADGIGFAFHNGNTTDVGNAGGNLGIGGLQNAIGFKLDTWRS